MDNRRSILLNYDLATRGYRSTRKFAASAATISVYNLQPHTTRQMMLERQIINGSGFVSLNLLQNVQTTLGRTLPTDCASLARI